MKDFTKIEMKNESVALDLVLLLKFNRHDVTEAHNYKSFKTSSIQKSITFNFVHFKEDQIVMSNVYLSGKKRG